MEDSINYHSVVSYFDIIYDYEPRNLNNVVRYSGRYCMIQESVGSHVIDMMSMSVKIAGIISGSCGINISIKDVIYKCYIHDLDESLYCDIPRDFKYANPQLTECIKNTVDYLVKDKLGEELASDIELSKGFHDIESTIVKIADVLQSSIKIHDEVKMGNFHFMPVLKEHMIFLESLISSIDGSELDTKVKLVIKNIIRDFKSRLDRINDRRSSVTNSNNI